MTTIATDVIFETPIAKAFDYLTTLGHWPEWYPATVAVRCEIDRPAPAGARAIEDVRKLGFRGTLRWLVTEVRPPAFFVMETEAVDLFPFRGVKIRISYELTEEAGRTRLRRTMSYFMPRPLLRLLDAVYLRRHLTTEAAVAMARLKALVEAQAPERAGSLAPRA
jgi:hypothetical protein